MINRQSSVENCKLKAFTLIELLVVIAIISLLVSILLPSLNRAKELAKRVICSSNMKNMASAMYVYADDNNGALPIRRNCWSHVYSQVDPVEGRYYCNLGLLAEGDYIPQQIIFCPGSKTPGYIATDSEGKEWVAGAPYYYLQVPQSYYYEPGPGFITKKILLYDLWTTVLLSDHVLGRYGIVQGFYHGVEGLNAAFIDGSARWVEDDRLYQRIYEDMEDDDGDYGLQGTYDCWEYLEEAH